MKNKMIEKISSSFSKIQELEISIGKELKIEKDRNPLEKIEVGSKIIELQRLNTQLFSDIDTFIDIMEGTIDELPNELKSYYKQVVEFNLPISEEDSQEIKKFKELIQKGKNGKL